MSHPAPETPARQLANLISRLAPAHRKLARTARAALRRRFPTAMELVYENFHALAIGYSPTEEMADAIVSVTINPMGARVTFLNGAMLPDPEHVLEGSGDQTRFISLGSSATLTTPEVEALIDAAIAHSKVPLPSEGAGDTVIKSIAVSEHSRGVLA
jgi:hypothetical protein